MVVSLISTAFRIAVAFLLIFQLVTPLFLDQQEQATEDPPTSKIPRACLPPHDEYPFCDLSLPLSDRLDDLIHRLNLEEKPLLLTARESPKGNISRLGIPECELLSTSDFSCS